MSQISDSFEGFNNLAEIVSNYIKGAENSQEAIAEGAKALVMDANKLPKPMSKIRNGKYTHLVRSFSYEKRQNEVVVGWGKYYGRMVENGTKNMTARKHLMPLFNKNSQKYYKIMLSTMGIKTW